MEPLTPKDPWLTAARAVAIFAGLLLLAMLLAGCQSTSGGSYCDIARPIRLSAGTVDAMSDREVEAVLAHNETGRRLCGWKR